MLINALCEYADKQKSKAGANSIPEGWAEQDIHYRIMLTSDGDIASIVDKRIEERKVDKKGKEKVTYVKMTPEKALEVVEKHLIRGQVVTEYTIQNVMK